MQEPFDPYYKWLAIPPREQPPNHYRLLGIPLFERDADVIEAAADQRMAHLRSMQNTAYLPLSQRLLNEVAAAKICLLDPQRRDAYERQLRESLPQPPRAIPLTPPVARPLAGAAPYERLDNSPRSAGDPSESRLPPLPRQFGRMATMAALAAIVLIVGGWLATAPSAHDRRSIAAANDAPRVRPVDSAHQPTTVKPAVADAARASQTPAPNDVTAERAPSKLADSPVANAARTSEDTANENASGSTAAESPPVSIGAFQLPEPAVAPRLVESWFAVGDVEKVPLADATEVCSADRSLKTALMWARSPEEAASQANRERKLVFLIHVSGNFEDPGFT